MEDVYEMSTKDVSKEEVHGGVQAWFHPDQDHEAQVPSQSQGIDPQKQHEEESLQLWTFWKSQKDEIGRHVDVPFHGRVSSLSYLQAQKWDSWGVKIQVEKPLCSVMES